MCATHTIVLDTKCFQYSLVWKLQIMDVVLSAKEWLSLKKPYSTVAVQQFIIFTEVSNFEYMKITQSRANYWANILITLHIRTTNAAIHYKCSYALFVATFKRYSSPLVHGSPRSQCSPLWAASCAGLCHGPPWGGSHYQSRPLSPATCQNRCSREWPHEGTPRASSGGCWRLLYRENGQCGGHLLTVQIWRVVVSTCLTSFSNNSATVKYHTLMNM